MNKQTLSLKKPTSRAKPVRKTGKHDERVRKVKTVEPNKPALKSETKTKKQHKPPSDESIDAAINWLRESHPNVFGEKAEIRPLQIGISKELMKSRPSYLTHNGLKYAIGQWCRRTSYSEAMLVYDNRYNLAGQPAGKVQLQDRENAQERLERCRKTSQKSTDTEQNDEQRQRTSA